MKKKLIIVSFLGFSSGLPLLLLSSTLQAWFASAGMPIHVTAMLSLISVPYSIRFIWGPFLDKYTIFNIGRRRSWILSTQIVLIIGFLSLSFFNPKNASNLMMLIAFFLAMVAATQDMAIEAHRPEYLPTNYYGLGASFATLGFRVALMLSGGVALMIAKHLGWSITYQLTTAGLLLGVIAIIISREPFVHQLPHTDLSHTYKAALKELLERPQAYYFFGLVFFYKLGEAFTSTTSGIVMPFLIQGLGFEIDTVGFVVKIAGLVAIIVGGLLAGILMIRWSLFRALFIFGLLQAITNGLFVILSLVGKQYWMLVASVITDNFAAGLGTTAIVACMMKVVNHQYTAFQFSLLAGFASIPRIISGPLGACLYEYVGWTVLYSLTVLFALIYIPFLYKSRSFIK